MDSLTIDTSTIALCIGLGFGLMLVALSTLRHRSRVVVVSIAAVWLAASGGFAWNVGPRVDTSASSEFATGGAAEVTGDGYVSSDTCRSCHPHEYSTWHDSYHRTMTQVAGVESVVGDFENVELEFAGRTYRMMRRGDEYWMELDDPNWSGDPAEVPRVERKIVMTTGSHHMQFYWHTTGRGREVRLAPFGYLIDRQEWIPTRATFLVPPWPADTVMPSESIVRWDKGCIKCHATSGQPRFRMSADGESDMRAAELGIACEACHGPGAAHLRANANPVRRYGHHLSDEPDSTIIQPLRLDSRRSSQVCGQCHSIFQIKSSEDIAHWRKKGFPYRPGDNLAEMRHIVRPNQDQGHPVMERVLRKDPHLIEESFWSDGMVRVSGREYNGLIESPCYQRGELSCFSCHQLHKPQDDPRSVREWSNDQLALGMDGQNACLQCHESYAANLQEHTHHLPQSTGSMCYNCHMPYTTYGLHKAIRSHQIDSPSVGASIETGRPNACNQCHLDKTLAWTAEHLENWYEAPKPQLTDVEQSVAASIVWLLTGDAGQRALMAWSFGWDTAQAASGTDWMGPYLTQLLADPYDAVRFIAYRSLRTMPGYEAFEYDFMAPWDARYAAASPFLKAWINRRVDVKSTGDELLMDAEGNLQHERFRRLLKQRNDRRVLLRE